VNLLTNQFHSGEKGEDPDLGDQMTLDTSVTGSGTLRERPRRNAFPRCVSFLGKVSNGTSVFGSHGDTASALVRGSGGEPGGDGLEEGGDEGEGVAGLGGVQRVPRHLHQDGDQAVQVGLKLALPLHRHRLRPQIYTVSRVEDPYI